MSGVRQSLGQQEPVPGWKARRPMAQVPEEGHGEQGRNSKKSEFVFEEPSHKNLL
jgi:hypothetical protein